MKELIVDSFAGGGGASLGIEWALGRSPDVAINHDEAAIVMHARNHPKTRHFTEDIWKLSPRQVTGGKPVGLLWASPDCKHFSRAKGAKPVEKKIRSLAWVIAKWAAEASPRVIILENVREFQDWGPLNAKSMPDPKKKGLTFKRFVNRFRALGYEVEWRVLNASDYGAPTHRRRLFLVARRDGQPVVWPEPTHGDPKKVGNSLFSVNLKPWRTAAECIDWSLPCPSIFDRKKPLAEKTMARIAHGIKKYVIDDPNPFIVNDYAPSIIQTGYGERAGQAPRTLDLNQPMGTAVAGGAKKALVAAFLKKYHGVFKGSREFRGQSPEQPLAVIDTANRHAVVTANLVHMNNGHSWSSAAAPMRTITSAGTHAALVYAFLIKYFGTGVGQVIDEPLHTVTTKDRFGLIVVHVKGEPHVLVDIGLRMFTPRELARGQGFPDSYILTGTASNQVARIGNSVSPYNAEALVTANYSPVFSMAA